MRTLTNISLIINVISITFCSLPFDTGIIDWLQPNGYTFEARYWGNQFAAQYETADGYRIVKDTDDYFKYAVLDEFGEFTASENIVGQDSILYSSFKLERSQVRKLQIELEIENYYLSLQIANENYMELSTRSDSVNFGVVLVDFGGSETGEYHYQSEEYPHGYPKEYFDNLIFSDGMEYYDDDAGEPNLHPEGDLVFGSMRDYYAQQSDSNLILIGHNDNPNSILNPGIEINGVIYPQWVVLPEYKGFYDTFHNWSLLSTGIFLDEILELLNEIGGDTSQIDYFGIIFAGEEYDENLVVQAIPYQDMYLMPERYTNIVFNEENVGFGHIGPHCHEFGHLIGAGDEYDPYEDSPTHPDPSRWDLMSFGAYNGPVYNYINGASPAGFSPPYKIDKFEWMQAETLNTPHTLTLNYNYDNPEYYIVPVLDSIEYFVLENRLRDGFDKFTPLEEDLNYNDPSDPNGVFGGLLIWHGKDGYLNLGASDFVELEAANNLIGFDIECNSEGDNIYVECEDYPYMYYGNPFPYGGNGTDGNNQLFYDCTTPSTNNRNGENSELVFKNIFWDEEFENTTLEILNWDQSIIGDYNGDGYSSISDFIAIYSTILGNLTLNAEELFQLDSNLDCMININDLLWMLFKILGIPVPEQNQLHNNFVSRNDVRLDSHTLITEIHLANEATIYVSKLTLNIPPDHVITEIRKTDRSSEMQIEWRYDEELSILHLVIFNTEGGYIQPGEGKIVDIDLESSTLSRSDSNDEGTSISSIEITNSPNYLLNCDVLEYDLYKENIDIVSEQPYLEKFRLNSVSPNPFNHSVNINFQLSENSHINIGLFDLKGEKVYSIYNGYKDKGIHQLNWNSDYLPSGVYFLKLTGNNNVISRKITLLK